MSYAIAGILPDVSGFNMDKQDEQDFFILFILFIHINFAALSRCITILSHRDRPTSNYFDWPYCRRSAGNKLPKPAQYGSTKHCARQTAIRRGECVAESTTQQSGLG